MNATRSTARTAACIAAIGFTTVGAVGFGLAANAQTTTTTQAPTTATATAPVEGVAGQSDLTVLAKALAATGLDIKLKTGGPYTIFAPNDLAFGVLPNASIESLLKPEKKDELTKILLQHVVKGTFSAGDIARSIAGVGVALPRVATVNQTVVRAPNGALVTNQVTVNPPTAPVPSFKVAYPVDQFVDRAFSAAFVSSESNPAPGVFVTLAGTRITLSAPLVQEGEGATSRRVQRIFFGPGHVVSPDLKADANLVHKIDTVVIKP
jgi:uncharacterized surface protein with fasciclin (FAS1) repeats